LAIRLLVADRIRVRRLRSSACRLFCTCACETPLGR
jgi:hypothetical protein